MAEETSRIVVGVDTSQLGKAKTEGVRTFESIREAAEKASNAVAATDKALSGSVSAVKTATAASAQSTAQSKSAWSAMRAESEARVAANLAMIESARAAQKATAATQQQATATQTLDGTVRQSANGFTEQARAVDKSTASQRTMEGVASRLKGVIFSLGAAFSVRQLINYADTQTLIAGRLTLVATETDSVRQMQDALFESSQRTKSSYEATATLFSRVAMNAKELGRSKADIMAFVETIQLAGRVGGSSAQEMANGTVQLAQAFGRGVLRGQDFISVISQMPGVAKAIADGWENADGSIGVTTASLIAMAGEGELGMDKVIAATLRMQNQMAESAASMPVTMGQSFTLLNNSIGKFIGMANDATSATGFLSGKIEQLANKVSLAADVMRTSWEVLKLGASSFVNEPINKVIGFMRGQTTAAEGASAGLVGLAEAYRKAEAAKNAYVSGKMPASASLSTTAGAPTVVSAAKEVDSIERVAEARKRADKVREDIARAEKQAADEKIRLLNEIEAATDSYYARVNAGHIANVRTVEDFTRQREEAEKLLAATKNGEMALGRYHVSLAIANVERGREVALTADQVAKVRQEIEARDEATRKTAAYNEAQKTTTAVIQKQAAVATSPFTSAVENMQRAFSDGIFDMLSGGINSFKDFANTVRDIMLKMVAQVVSARVLQKVLGGAMAGLAGVAGVAGAQGGSHGAGLSGGLGLGAGAMSLAGSGIGGFGAGYGIGSMSGGRTMGALGGAAGGAAAGFAIGGPVGAIIGGVSGLVGGLFGSAKKAKEAARTMEDARKAFALNMDQFVATAYGTNNALADALRQNEATRNELMKQADAANPGRKNEPARHVEEAKIMSAAAANAARLREEFRAGIDEQIRGFSETGRAENDRLAIDKAYRENLKSAVAAGMSAAKVEELRTLQLNALIAAEAAYAEALRYTSQVRDEDLAVRQMAADGDARGAADRRFMLDQDREMHDARMAGWTDAQIAQLTYIQGMEAQNRATAAATQAAKDAADAQAKLAESQRQAVLAMQDLDVRMLFATGKDAEGAQLRFDLGQSNEMEEAVRSGKSAEYLKKLDDVQRLEAKRRQAELDAAAVDALIRETGGSTGSRSLNAATSATSAQTDRLLAYTATSTEYLRRIANAVEGNSGSTSGVVPRTAPDIGEIDRGLFSATGQASRSAGNPGILI